MNKPLSLERESLFDANLSLENKVEVKLELDINSDNKSDIFSKHSYSAGKWTSESSPSDVSLSKLPTPYFIYKNYETESNSREIIGVGINIQREYLKLESENIGWQIQVHVPDINTRESIPLKGFHFTDITLPYFSATLESESIYESTVNGTINLGGALSTSSTFSGSHDIKVNLFSNGNCITLPPSTLIQPYEDNWQYRLNLPNEVITGKYDLQVQLRCEDCSLEQNLFSKLIVYPDEK